MHLQPGAAILSIYPHDKRPEIIGNFIRSLAQARVIIHGLASSPSAISAVLSSKRAKTAVRQLFENFHFPAFASPEDFLAAQSPPEELVRKVVADLSGKSHQGLLDRAPAGPGPVGHDRFLDRHPGRFCRRPPELGDLGLQIPFLVAIPGLGNREFLLSFSTTGPQSREERGSEIRRILKKHLPDLRPMRLTPVAGIFLHGPHFGDRYGIAQTLTECPGEGPCDPAGSELHHLVHLPHYPAARTGRGATGPDQHLCGPGGGPGGRESHHESRAR